mmetsp:Transcript_21441/g.59543  ORF Transcript_21441/g.59543 Transcript_21441/m.59543 type:complete len:380 (+) Transcript_21441:2378-3517(+)
MLGVEGRCALHDDAAGVLREVCEVNPVLLVVMLQQLHELSAAPLKRPDHLILKLHQVPRWRHRYVPIGVLHLQELNTLLCNLICVAFPRHSGADVGECPAKLRIELVPEPEAIGHVLLAVIVADDDPGLDLIVFRGHVGMQRLHLGLRVWDVVGAVGHRVDFTEDDTVHQYFVCAFQENDLVRDELRRLESGNLAVTVREAIQQPPGALAVLLCQPGLRQLDEDIVGYSFGGVDELFGPKAKRRLFCNLCLKQFTGIDPRNAKLMREAVAQRGLADCRRAQNHHLEGLLAVSAEVGIPELPAITPDLSRWHHGGIALAHSVEKAGVGPLVVALHHVTVEVEESRGPGSLHLILGHCCHGICSIKGLIPDRGILHGLLPQ